MSSLFTLPGGRNKRNWKKTVDESLRLDSLYYEKTIHWVRVEPGFLRLTGEELAYEPADHTVRINDGRLLTRGMGPG
jgi:hypothetical protein